MEKRGYWSTTVSLLLVCTGGAWAQQGTRAGVASSVPGLNEGESEPAVSAATPQGSYSETPSVPALAGAQEFAPGSATPARSYLLPSFQWAGLGDTNVTGTTGRSELSLESTYVGNITLQRSRKRSQLNLDYAGGAYFYSGPIEGDFKTLPSTNGSFHRLGVTHTFNWRRWQVFLGDDFLYLPESPLGFSGFSGLESFGSGQGGSFLGNATRVNPAFDPNQDILTGESRRLSNVVTGQIEYSIGKRSAITFASAYGNLHFLDAGFTDNRYLLMQAGYNHALTRSDFVSIFYVHTLYKFDLPNRDILYRGIQGAYGHRLTGRLSLELSGGPLINQIGVPLGGSMSSVFWATHDSLKYRSRRVDMDLSFARGISGGSGVLAGAESDLVELQVGRQLSRRIHGSVILAHTFDQSLDQEVAIQRNSKFESWLGGVLLSRELGRTMSVFVDYKVEREAFSDPTCLSSRCSRFFIRHVGGAGFNWHGRPLKIR